MVSGSSDRDLRELSFVNSTGSGCLIHRETCGRYVVSHAAVPDGQLHAATLAGAYAACRGWDAVLLRQQGSER